MTGQDALNVATAFHNAAALTGFILTKLDGDARGGAALSVKAVTGKPIKFIGVGERLEALEPLHPDRMASRILNMGDVVSLVEKAEQAVEAERAAALAEKLRTNRLSLNDFLEQLQQVRKMGPIKELLSMIPGMGGIDTDAAQEELPRIEAIIRSMTPGERESPHI